VTIIWMRGASPAQNFWFWLAAWVGSSQRERVYFGRFGRNLFLPGKRPSV